MSYLIVTLIYGMGAPVYASSESMQKVIIPFAENINSIHKRLFVSGSIATIKAEAIGVIGTTKSIQMIVYFQRKTNGSWRTIKTYSDHGTSSCSVSANYTLTMKRSYRIKVSVTANGWENEVVYAYASY